MAVVQYGNGGIQYDNPFVMGNGRLNSVTSSEVVSTKLTGEKLVATGTFDLYINHLETTPTSGTLNTLTLYKPDGALDFSVTNMEISYAFINSDIRNIITFWKVALAGDDTLIGGDGNDSFLASSGGDSYDGSTGIDTVVYSGIRSAHIVTKGADSGTLTVSEPYSYPNDSLVNIERLHFSDNKAIAFDTEGAAGQTYRLYQAAFDRTPDAGGLGYWISVIDNGASLADVAAGFMNSQEFMNLYGTAPSNAELVTRFYQNVLDRAPDDSGFQYWTGLLDSHQRSAVEVMIGFSESTENKAAIIGSISSGMEYDLWLG